MEANYQASRKQEKTNAGFSRDIITSISVVVLTKRADSQR